MTQRRLLAVAIALGAFAITSCNDETAPTQPSVEAQPSNAPDFAVGSNSWSTLSRMPTGRSGLAVGVANTGGKPIVYAIGGLAIGGTSDGAAVSTVHAYNVATNTWTTKAPMPVALTRTNGVADIGGKLYVSGGEMVSGDSEDSPNEVSYLFAYDTKTNSWSRKADMPRPISRGITGVINNKMYVLTGGCGHNRCAEYVTFRLYVYDPVTNTWDTSLPSCPDAHLDGAGGVINGKFYVAGGSGRDHNRSNKLHVFDPATRKWATKAPMPSARNLVAGAVLAGRLFIIGGNAGAGGDPAAPGSEVNTVQAYDPVKNTWSTRTPMPSARAGLGAARGTLDGQSRIFAVGGRGNPRANEAYTF